MEEFRQIDRSKYHVAQCLFTARRIFKLNGKLAFPKYHLLVVDRSAEEDAVVRCLGLFFLQDLRGGGAFGCVFTVGCYGRGYLVHNPLK